MRIIFASTEDSFDCAVGNYNLTCLLTGILRTSGSVPALCNDYWLFFFFIANKAAVSVTVLVLLLTLPLSPGHCNC